ncbi:hypothetical protein [Catenuloplanes atrovinosus]|uniref:Secreted protein n=1 Tax=Catenuloplanes atrovinosus TaxID=137266 RepID=A0AAE4CBN8_9ACTN|nr:hypothetical protein [Catenuloplanes atrovinosus]MDR7277124.1 hypothetical protein [Catenuloplanes atrovinosus]
MRRIATTLMLSLSLVLTLAPAATAVPDADLTVSGQWALLSDDPATVALVGKYTCGPYPGGVPDRGVIDLSVDQRVNGAIRRGTGYLTPTVCDGTPQWFAAGVTTVDGSAFRRATATWSASGYVEGPGGLQHGAVPPTTIQIR